MLRGSPAGAGSGGGALPSAPAGPTFAGRRFRHRIEGDLVGVDQDLAGVLEIDGHPVTDGRLDLAESPIGAFGMADQCAWGEVLGHGRELLFVADIVLSQILAAKSKSAEAPSARLC